MSRLVFVDYLFNGVGRIKQLLDPVDPQDAATKGYVDRVGLYSGTDLIEDGNTLVIEEHFQMINFTTLNIEGILYLEGDLWLV